MITFKRILATANMFKNLQHSVKNITTPHSIITKLTHQNVFNFAFMALFENNKRPAQLDPAFKRKTKLKGHVKHKRDNSVVSSKLNTKVIDQKQKLKNHRGLLKRIKIVGPRWDRQFKFKSPHRYHLRRNKTKTNLKRKLRARYVAKSDLWRVRRLLPYFKRRSLKQMY